MPRLLLRALAWVVVHVGAIDLCLQGLYRARGLRLSSWQYETLLCQAWRGHHCATEGAASGAASMIDEVSEADEAATDKATALANLREQFEKGETHGVVAMYIQAAWNAGASVAETEQVLNDARKR